MGQRYAAERCAHGWPQVVSLARRRYPPDGARGGTPGQPPGGLLPPGQPRQLQTGDRAPPHAPSAKQAMAVPPLAGAVVEPAIGSRGARDPASRFGAAAAAVLCGCAGGGTGAASARIGCVLRRDAGGARRGRPTRAPPRMVVPGPPWIREGAGGKRMPPPTPGAQKTDAKKRPCQSALPTRRCRPTAGGCCPAPAGCTAAPPASPHPPPSKKKRDLARGVHLPAELCPPTPPPKNSQWHMAPLPPPPRPLPPTPLPSAPRWPPCSSAACRPSLPSAPRRQPLPSA